MAILIDPPAWPAHGQLWSHLVSDTSTAELHRFAERLRIPRRGFDLDHYDVPARLYADAVALGATPVLGRDIVRALQRSGLRVRQVDRSSAVPGSRAAFLREEWDRLGSLLELPPSGSAARRWLTLGAELGERWREPHRSYHDERHLEDVLLAMNHLGTLGERVQPASLLAAWFHDAVYTGHGGDERASAELAAAELGGLRLDSDTVAETHALILATDPEHPSELAATASAHLHDADLWVFASAPGRYAEYTAGVRAEYAHLSAAEFRSGRARILRGFLDRPTLFRTEPALTLWEMRARANVSAEIAELSAEH